jgi:predicted MFS family arabinose efflux permease
MFAGAIIAGWGTAPVIFCNALGALWFAVSLTIMRNAFTVPIRARGKPRHMLGEVRDGLAYAMSHPGIRPTMVILSTLSILPFSIDLLLPSLADGVYHEGAHGLALMTSAIGLGAMAQALTIARRGIPGLTRYVVNAILVTALAYLALAFSAWFWLGLACVLVVGFTASSVRVGSMTLLQYSVDPDMRGRVASFYGMINHSGPALGALLIGALGDRLGIPFMMGVIGVVTLAIWAWAASRRAVMAASLEVEGRAQTAAPPKDKAAE